MKNRKNNPAIKFIEWYQKGISPNNPPRCRFYPSCSQYAKECYLKFNFVKASFLTLKRLLRCNKLFKGGYDPVPLTKEEKIEALNETLDLAINEDNENSKQQ
ncbi:MAG: membrane protein insertion efficiency factor YidD [Acholeplasmatales bacterium]|nr:membrane protein insertion efficiency factor YidD [Acholeplasmatales bacterium]